MLTERRQRALKALSLRHQGLRHKDIAKKLGVSEPTISQDLAQIEFSPGPALAGAIEALFQHVMTPQFKSLLSAAKKDRTSASEMLSLIGFLTTSVDTMRELIVDTQKEQLKALAEKQPTPAHPAQAYADDLTKGRG